MRQIPSLELPSDAQGESNGELHRSSRQGVRPPLSPRSAAAWPALLKPREPCSAGDREIYESLVSIDWASRPGMSPIELWPPCLRTVVHQCMHARFPCLIFWGPQLVHIYNSAFASTIGAGQHPGSLGSTWQDVWGDLIDDPEERQQELRELMAAGQGMSMDKREHVVTRNKGDPLHEWKQSFFTTYHAMPILEFDGSTGGLVFYVHDVTPSVHASMREKAIVELELISNGVNTREQWLAKADDIISRPDMKEIFPIFVAYVRKIKDEQSEPEGYITRNANGVRKSSIPETITMEELSAYCTSEPTSNDAGEPLTMRDYICKAVITRKPQIVRDARVLQKLCAGRCHGERTRFVMVTPQFVPSIAGDDAAAVHIIGLNPRWDAEDERNVEFIHQACRTLNKAMRVVRFRVLEQKEAKRQQLDLLAELAERTAETAEYRERFEVMIKTCPTGCFIYDLQRERFIYINDTYYHLTGMPLPDCEPSERPAPDWTEYIHPDSRDEGIRRWEEVRKWGITDYEARWKTPNPDGSERWTLSTSTTQQDSHGNRFIFGHFTNVSPQKYAQRIESARADDAVKMRTQQLEFIDMIAHELRNPLGAIAQSADFLLEKIDREQQAKQIMGPQYADRCDQTFADDDVEDLRTIVLCAQHMSRIINDTLNLSKLEGGHLIATNVPTSPMQVVSSVMSMFDAEAKRSGTLMRFEIDESFRQLGVSWVMTDPSRLTQIVVNLVSNSIKFTSRMEKRVVTIRLAASRHPDMHQQHRETRRPSFKKGNSASQIVTANMQPADDELYLVFHVEDTGPGMSQSQVDSLFQRFFQCSAKTHVLYGGSGLGLFISKQLVTLLQGTISVTSKQGEGTTFSFNIKAPRCSAPRRGSQLRQRNVREITVMCGAGVGPGQGKVRYNSRPGTPLNEVLRPPLERHVSSAAVSDAGEQLDPEQRNPRHLKLPQADTQPERSPLILLAEDNLINQRILCKQLKQAGFRTLVANNGKEAVDLLVKDRQGGENGEIDLCLCDIEMPVLGGLDCIREVRALEQGITPPVVSARKKAQDTHLGIVTPSTDGSSGASTPETDSPKDELFECPLADRAAALSKGHVPFIAVTANARQEQVQEMLQAGFDDAVSKPFRIADLVDKMRRWMHHGSDDESGASSPDREYHPEVPSTKLPPTIAEYSGPQRSIESPAPSSPGRSKKPELRIPLPQPAFKKVSEVLPTPYVELSPESTYAYDN
ncbi:cAMP-dependent protein kinase subunit [Savitreella phatthalungensis]